MKELPKCTCTVRCNIRQCDQKIYRCKQFLPMLYNRCSSEDSLILMKTEAADYLQSNSSKFGHSVHLTATNLNHICRRTFFQVTSKIRHFLPSYFQDRAFSSKLLPNKAFSSKLLPISGLFFQVTSKIHTFLARSCNTRHFLPRYLQEQCIVF